MWTWETGRRLEAVEIWVSLTRTSRIYKKNNEQVLNQIKETRNLLQNIRKRKIKLLGHMLNYDIFLQNIFEGKVLGEIRENDQDFYLKIRLHEMKLFI